MATEPAPRYSEVNTRLAPKRRILVENGHLQSGLGLVPGATKSEEVKLKENNLISGRGLVP